MPYLTDGKQGNYVNAVFVDVSSRYQTHVAICYLTFISDVF